MSKPFARPALQGVAVQIIGIVAVCALLAVGLAATFWFVFFGSASSRGSPCAAAAQIATVMQLVRASRKPADSATIISTAQRAGIQVWQGASQGIAATIEDSRLPILQQLVARELEAGWNMDAMLTSSRMAIRLDENSVLLFVSDQQPYWGPSLIAPIALAVNLVLIAVLLSVYVRRSIVGPLSTLAAAAHSFAGAAKEAPVPKLGGPREIEQLEDAWSEMRTRARSLLEDRNRMLAALSHDLRVPLTRLRLRAESSGAQSAPGMIHDIERMDRMLDATLRYLRDDFRAEAMEWVDLPSLLQTICSEASDAGDTVRYHGVQKLPWRCRPHALERAITNIVENAGKHAATTSIHLRLREDGRAEIEVCDDGPGIPVSLREKVFEPFFRAEGTGAASEGFGLGLSIARDVIRDHGGDIHLLERVPRGLVVRVVLPSHQL